jgi:kynurenine formamidase
MHREPLELPIKSLMTSLVRDGRVYELSHPMSPGMPVFRQHVQYTISLNRRHSDPHAQPRPGKSSFANEIIVMSAHTGTHIDALGHFSRDGKLYGHCIANEVESSDGLAKLDAAEIGPIFCRGVLLDVARSRGVTVMNPGDAIDATELRSVAESQTTEIAPGDLVLVRTGWSQHWSDPAVFNGERGGFPGPDSEAAHWLLERGAAMVGSDTPVFEANPFPKDSVHALLLVDRGIHIIENLYLEQLSRDHTYVFLFIALPLRLCGATGSPLRPIAIC